MAPRPVATVGPDGTARENSFSCEGGRISFGSKLFIDRVAPRVDPDAAADFFSEPQRILASVWDADKIKVVDAQQGDFDLTLRPLRFVMLRFQPSVRVRIVYDPEERCINMLSNQFSLGSSEKLEASVAKTVSVDVEGRLAICAEGDDARLVGKVQFVTMGQLPRVLRLVPNRVLRSAGELINSQILEYVKAKFLGQLTNELQTWTRKTEAGEVAVGRVAKTF